MSNENSRQFSLADLIPEPLEFLDTASEGGNGQVYDVLAAKMLGPSAFAEMQILSKRVKAFYNGGNVTLENAGQIEKVADKFIRILIPNLPEARVATMGFDNKFKFIQWWMSNVPAQTGGTAAASAPNPTQAVQPAPHKRRRRRR